MIMNLRRMFLGLLLIAATQVHAAPFAYITSEVDGTVSVIDTATNVVVTTIPVGRFPLGVAVSILMESKSRGLFTSHQGERGGFAVFACGEVLASAAGWFALRHARRANGAKWTKAVAASAGVLGAIGAIIALLILLRDGVP